MDWCVQLVGFLGLAMSIGSYQFKKYRHIILCKTLSELTFAVQYLLLGAWTAAALETLSVIRNLLFCHREKKNQSTTPLILVFAVFVVVIGLVTYAGPISLLPMAAKLLTTVSYGITKEKWLRVLSLAW